MKTADEIYTRWHCEYLSGEHPTKTHSEIVILAMEEYKNQFMDEYEKLIQGGVEKGFPTFLYLNK